MQANVPPPPTPIHHRINSPRRQSNTDLCIICLDRTVTTRLNPCQHSHFCETCAAMILAGAIHDPPECPLCRQAVHSHEPAAPTEVTTQALDRPLASRIVDTFAYAMLNRQQHNTLQDYHGSSTPWYYGPWWPQEEEHGHYLNEPLTLADGEVGLMPDTGAHDGLCGDRWARTQADHCRQNHKTVGQRKLEQPRNVRGVGHGSQTADYEVELACGLQDVHGRLHEETYRAPCIEGWDGPGLMGIQSLERSDALIRCKTGEIWFLGQGGVKIEPSPGSRHFQMKKARSGHWMIPINRFTNNAPSKGMVLPTTTATASTNTPMTTSSKPL